MNVTQIVLNNFMRHRNTDLRVPERGIVLVTGENGAGKSSMVEGVAMAFWGKTLRGTAPWLDGEGGLATVAADVAVSNRVRLKGGKTALSWHAPDVEAVQYENTTKAQEALSKVVGDFDLWRCTHVFSSSDLASLLRASDGELKRLLENLLGFDRFEPALKDCRADLGKAKAHQTQAESKLEVLAERRRAAVRTLADTTEALGRLGVLPDFAATSAKAAELANDVEDCDRDLDEVQAKIAGRNRAAGRAAGEAEAAERRHYAFKARTSCDMCGQDLSVERMAELARAAVQARRVAEDAGRQAAADIERFNVELTALRETRDLHAKALQRAQATLRDRARLQDEHDRAAQAQARAQAFLETVDQDLDRAQKDVDKWRQETAVLEAVEGVLGLRGVRAHILGRAVSGLRDAGNAWLARLAGPGVTLSVDQEDDRLNLEIKGFGGGLGYRASSGGERRRLDIATLLALADVARAVRGGGGWGTLFFDEVFDALDEDGIAAVKDVLTELAQERAVVVISHADSVIAGLPAVVRWTVSDGTVTEA